MGTRVLLADDSITIQKLVEMAFADTDFELVCVSDGQQAIEKLAEFKPQIVLADAIMPVRDGYQVCEYLRHQPGYRDIPVVLLTGRFQPYDEARSKAVGITERIVKPFVQDQLVSLVRQLVPEQGQDTLELEGEDGAAAPELLADELLEPMDEGAGTGSVEAADMSLDSHATIRVKPDDLKAFLREVEKPAVEELDLDQENSQEIEDLDLSEEEDVAASFSKSFDSLEMEVPQEISFTSAPSPDRAEELDLDETVSMEGTRSYAGSFSPEQDEPPTSASQPEEDLEKTLRLQDEEVLELQPEAGQWQDLPDANQVRTVSFDEPAQSFAVEEDAWTAPTPVFDAPIGTAHGMPAAEPAFAQAEAMDEPLADWDVQEALPDQPDFHSDSFELQPPNSFDFEPAAELRAEDGLLDLDADLATEPVDGEKWTRATQAAGSDEAMELEELSSQDSAMEVHFEGEAKADWPPVPAAAEPGEEDLLELIEEDEQASIPTENLDETFYPELEEPLGHNLPLDSREDRIDTGPVDLPLEGEEPPLLSEDSLPDLEEMVEEPVMGALVSSLPAEAEPADLPPVDLHREEDLSREPGGDFEQPMGPSIGEPFDEPFGEPYGEPFAQPVGESAEPAGEDFAMEEAVLIEEVGVGAIQTIEEPLVSELDEEVLQTQETPAMNEPAMTEWVALEDSPPSSSESTRLSSPEEDDTESHLAMPVLPSLELDEKPAAGAIELSKNQLDYLVEAVARRVVELLSDEAVKEIAWEVIPELSEAMIKKRIYELEKSVDSD